MSTSKLVVTLREAAANINRDLGKLFDMRVAAGELEPVTAEKCRAMVQAQIEIAIQAATDAVH